MKDSSWLINISISLIKIYFTSNIVSLVDIMYQRGFGNDGFEEIILFFAKLF
jgi:hypothetical protein